MLRRKNTHLSDIRVSASSKKKVESSAQRTIRRIERLQRTASIGESTITDWEGEFLADVDQRLRKFGRAFVDPEKGNLALPVSIRQAIKLGEIHRSLKRQAKRKT